MVSKSFDINSGQLQTFEPGSRRLLLEISPAAISVIFWNKEKNAPEALEVFAGNFNTASDWEQMVQQSNLLGWRELETDIYHAFETMLPIPARLYEPGIAREQIRIFYGSKPGLYGSADVLPNEAMILAWEMPLEVYEFVEAHFKVFRLKHIGVCLLQDDLDGDGARGRVVVYGSQCWISLWNNGALQIIKSVQVSQPDDLSWHLLNICKQFGFEPASVSWELAGMAEESSPLWNAVTRYFDPVQAMPSVVELPEELPAHYFAHLYKCML